MCLCVTFHCHETMPLASQQRGGRIEIVFISNDRSESEFASYFSEMPWLALPYVLHLMCL